jgi:hypothetical protein
VFRSNKPIKKSFWVIKCLKQRSIAMTKQIVKSAQLTYSARIIILLLASGLAGCSMYGYRQATPQAVSSTSGKNTTAADRQDASQDVPYLWGDGGM